MTQGPQPVVVKCSFGGLDRQGLTWFGVRLRNSRFAGIVSSYVSKSSAAKVNLNRMRPLSDNRRVGSDLGYRFRPHSRCAIGTRRMTGTWRSRRCVRDWLRIYAHGAGISSVLTRSPR
jgi:hypothetical protein